MRRYLLTLWAVMAAAILVLMLSRGAGAAPIRQDQPQPEAPKASLYMPHLQGASAPSLTYAERMAVLSSVQQAYDAMPGDDLVAERKALADEILTLPHVEASGVEADGSVWGRFTDQRLFVVAPTLREPVTTTVAAAEAAPGALPDNELPGKDKVYVLNALGTCFVSPANQLSKLLVDKKYVDSGVTPSVDNLKVVREAAVFYVDTHGAVASNRSNIPLYSLWTSTLFSQANETAYAADLNANNLTYMLAAHNRTPPGSPKRCTSEWHYGITASFVSAYMQFAPHSLVFFNGCSSMSAGASALRTAFGQAGATMYLGWTLPVMDPEAVRAGWFLFDRLLGSNFYQPETPDQRPFDLQSVMTDIQNRGYDQSVYCNNRKPTCPPGNVVTSTLQLQALTSITDDQFSLLTPTIKRMETDDPPCCGEPRPIIWLNLEGHFGSVQGDVLVDNQSLPILSWSRDLIRAELPAHGPGSAGPVTVTVRGHASNAAPLTEWRGRVTWDEEYDRLGGGPGPFAEVACDLHFRSNFHAARDASGRQPVWPAVAAVEESQDSECIWSMGGASNWVEPSTGDAMRGVLSGSGTLAWRPSNATPGPYLGFSAVIEPEQKRLVMSLVGTDQGTWRVYRNGKLSHSTKQALYGTGPLTLPLDNDYNIKAGSSTFEFALGPVTTQWGSIPARFAPKGSTPAQQ